MSILHLNKTRPSNYIIFTSTDIEITQGLIKFPTSLYNISRFNSSYQYLLRKNIKYKNIVPSRSIYLSPYPCRRREYLILVLTLDDVNIIIDKLIGLGLWKYENRV